MYIKPLYIRYAKTCFLAVSLSLSYSSSAQTPILKASAKPLVTAKTIVKKAEQPEPEYVSRYGEQNGSTFGFFEKGAVVYALATDVNLRETPDTEGKIIATIAIGTPVKIEEQLEKTYKKSGFTAPWHKISFTDGSNKKTGYVWGGMLTQALARTKQTDGTVFLLGINSLNTDKMSAKLQLRAARNGKEVTKMEFGTQATFEPQGMSIQQVSLGTAGFTNGIADALLFSVGYPACGYTQAERLIMWDGKQLFDGFEATSTGDAGVFSENNDLVFPNEKDGKPQSIVVKYTLEQTDEKEKTTTKHKTTIYKWNNRKFVK